MRQIGATIVVALSTLLLASDCSAQQASNPPVPNLIRYSGTLKDARGEAPIGKTVGVTFAIYKQQDGGAPVWLETQNVTPGSDGRYSVLLGSTTAAGMPGDLFSQQEERWLGVEAEGQAEQPRVLLVSVPFAFKVQEAEMGGGLPGSAHTKANPLPSPATKKEQSGPTTALPAGGDQILRGQGVVNYLPMWVTPTVLHNSGIYQAGGNFGIGTSAPQARLDVNGAINSATGYGIGGSSVLRLGSSGDGNLFLGVGTGASNLAGQGQFNLFSGYMAGFSNTYGFDNVFSGYQAGMNNTTGRNSVLIGAVAGVNTTTGIENVFLGNQSGYTNTVGGGNVFLGYGAGYLNTNGNANTFVGVGAGDHNLSGGFNIYIGAFSGSGSDENNTIRIGTGQQSAAYMGGIFSSTSPGGVPVYVNSFAQLGTMTSSLRFKEQVRDMGDRTNALMKLRPVTFLYKPEYDKGERTLQYGLIAEEVAKVYPELVANDNDGQPYTVRYQYLTTMLLNEVQKQYHRAEAEAKVVAEQEQKIGELEQRLSRLETLVERVQTLAQK